VISREPTNPLSATRRSSQSVSCGNRSVSSSSRNVDRPDAQEGVEVGDDGVAAGAVGAGPGVPMAVDGMGTFWVVPTVVRETEQLDPTPAVQDPELKQMPVSV